MPTLEADTRLDANGMMFQMMAKSESLLREGLNHVIGHEDWKPEELIGRLMSHVFHHNGHVDYYIDDILFLQMDQPIIARRANAHEASEALTRTYQKVWMQLPKGCAS